MSAEISMLKARAQLLMDQPFFGTLALKLKLVQDENVKTAATDGQRLLYSDSFVNKLDSVQLRGLIAHEVMHCVFNHMTRRQNRDAEIWNAACDYAINSHLLESGFILPDGGLVDPAYKDMTAEAIYNKIKDKPPRPCPWGKVYDAGTGSVESSSGATLESQWQVATTQAAEAAKAQGKLPAHLERFIQDIVDPKVDWRSVLWPFLTSLVQNNYSWRKLNRAYISEDECLPSMHEEAAGEIGIVIDNSGSISNDELQQFVSEIIAVHGELEPEKIVFIQCDSRVNKVIEIDREEEICTKDLKIDGGGGTAFSPAFDYVNENHPDVEAVVYLTDLFCDDFGPEPMYPVLWVTTTKNDTVPWGQVAHM